MVVVPPPAAGEVEDARHDAGVHAEVADGLLEQVGELLRGEELDASEQAIVRAIVANAEAQLALAFRVAELTATVAAVGDRIDESVQPSLSDFMRGASR